MILAIFQLVAQQINNPILGPGLQNLSGVGFFQRLVPALVGLGFVIGVVIFFFIMLAGAIQWITSSGDKAAIEAARSKLTNALVGIVILFSLFAIVSVIENFFGINILQINIAGLQIGGGGGGGGGGCFLAKTKVKMTDGTYKEIQDIKPGDIVYSYNLKSKELVEAKVTKLLVHQNYPDGYLVLNGKLKVTGNHRMWLTNKSSWEKADTLKVGDTLLNPTGKEILISSIKKVEGKNTVYNLHLKGDEHNYFTENILVHNAKEP